jgi:phage/plasmid-associated DNA primase
MDFINKIMPVVEERDCLLRGLASGLYGKTLQKLFILTGEGGNGKDTLVSKFYRDTLGRDYYEYSNTTILTEKRKGDLCQGIANMDKKRAVVWSEPPKQSILQGAVIKEITGVDQVNARGLYSTNTTTRIMASCFVLCNDIPRVDAVDGGLARRLIVIAFRSLFKNPEEIEKMADKKNVYEADGYYDSQDFRDEMKHTFFHILLGYFKQFH